MIDKFGPSTYLRPDGEDTFIAQVRAIPVGVKFWALQYLSHVEVLQPDWLRQEVVDAIQKKPYENHEG